MPSALLRRLASWWPTPATRARWRAIAAEHRVGAHLAVGAIIGALVLAYAAFAGAFSHGLTPTRIVDRQQGPTPHAGFRRAHAKGICVEGVFRSDGAAAPWSVASVFAPGETPIAGRFSVGGNNPTAPDLRAGVRSLALEFRLANGERWRTAMNTNPVLPIRDPQGFYDQLAAMAPDPATGKPSPARMQAFFAAHPESAAFRAWQAGYRATSSFATERYHAINAFWLVDARGQRQAVRWRLLPVATDATAVGTGPDALQDELVARLARGPVAFRLNLVLAAPGDPVDDASQPWPELRRQVDAGTVVLQRATPQRNGACNVINFDPLVLPRGIVPSNDPILHARSAAYAESQRRRATEEASR